MHGALTGVHKRPAAPSEVYTRCHTSGVFSFKTGVFSFKTPLVGSYPLTNISIPSFLSAVHEKKKKIKKDEEGERTKP